MEVPQSGALTMTEAWAYKIPQPVADTIFYIFLFLYFFRNIA